MLKIDKYFDLRCDICYCQWSTDFEGGRGMFADAKVLRYCAKMAGWKYSRDHNVNLCPECAKLTKKELVEKLQST